MFLYCPEQNLLLETLSRICKLFLGFEKAHHINPDFATTLVLGTVFSDVSYKHTRCYNTIHTAPVEHINRSDGVSDNASGKEQLCPGRRTGTLLVMYVVLKMLVKVCRPAVVHC